MVKRLIQFGIAALIMMCAPAAVSAQSAKEDPSIYGVPSGEPKWSVSIQLGGFKHPATKSTTATIAVGPHRKIVGSEKFRINLGVSAFIFSENNQDTRAGLMLTVPVTYWNFTATYGRSLVNTGPRVSSHIVLIGISIDPF